VLSGADDADRRDRGTHVATVAAAIARWSSALRPIASRGTKALALLETVSVGDVDLGRFLASATAPC
jgi:hypothetical protein